MKQGNLFAKIPADLSREVFDSLVESARVRIERIISKGHTSPDSGWYDQDLSEWVVILRGEASITFDNGETVELAEGDYIEIPSHKKHKPVSCIKNASKTTRTHLSTRCAGRHTLVAGVHQ
ncbi:MAG: cupin domain-containing protein [Chromatiaceae bacterium]|nr:cupin domain-containing protein [Chromatiaceae bacterium]